MVIDWPSFGVGFLCGMFLPIFDIISVWVIHKIKNRVGKKL